MNNTNMNQNIKKKNKQNRGNPSPCPVCGVVISNSYNLSCHLRRHSNNKPFKCDKCPSSFIIESELKRHLVVHSTLRPFLCSICPKAYRNKIELQVHKERCHQLGSYKCNECDRTFQKNRYLIAHVKAIHNENTLKCSFCWKTFSSNLFKEDHEKTAHSRLYASRLTESTDTSAGSNIKKEHKLPLTKKKKYRPQLRTGDNDYKCFTCKFCDQRFKYKTEQFAHYKTIHNSEFDSVFKQCERCSKFLSKKRYPIHMKAHEGEFKHECTFCDFKSVTNTGLKLHLKVHSKELPAACSICNKPCKTRAQAYTCEQIHKGVRNVKCDDCDKRFYTRLALKTHRYCFHRTHKCPFCNYEADTRNILRLHKNRNHKQQILNANKRNMSLMCDICGMFFKSRSWLTSHTRNHMQNNEKTISLSETKAQIDLPVCRYCSYKGKSQQEILDHSLQLHPSKVFKCKICSFASLHSRKVEMHSKRHGEIVEQQESYFYTKFKQKYEHKYNVLEECFLCGYFSNCREHMEIHLRTHELFLEEFGWFNRINVEDSQLTKINFKDVTQKENSPENNLNEELVLATKAEPENSSSSYNTETSIKEEGLDNEIRVIAVDFAVDLDDSYCKKDGENSKQQANANAIAALLTPSVHIDTNVNWIRSIDQHNGTKNSISSARVLKVEDFSTFSGPTSVVKDDQNSKSDDESDLDTLSSKVKSFDGKLFLPIEDLFSMDDSSLTKEKVQKLLKEISQGS